MGDLSGWAQVAVTIAAVFGSGYYATRTVRLERRLEREDENRRRLSITTTRCQPAGMQLDFRYAPEFTHIGIMAKVTLLTPDGAVLQQLRRKHSSAATELGFAVLEQGGTFVGKTGSVRLVRLAAGQPCMGSMLVRPSHYAAQPLEAARIRIRIKTTAGEMLLETETEISPIDEAAFPSDGRRATALPPELVAELARDHSATDV